MNLKATVTVLGAAMLLSACVSQSKYNQEVQTANTYQQSAATYQKLDAQLKGTVGADQAQITQLQNVVKVTMASGILFAEGGVQINATGKALLDQLAPVLKTLSGQKIEVKGFTDNVPIGPELKAKFPTNADLSKARANDVASYLVAQGVPVGIIVATGYGEAQPVASNDTAQGRAKNRRVEMDIVEAK